MTFQLAEAVSNTTWIEFITTGMLMMMAFANSATTIFSWWMHHELKITRQEIAKVCVATNGMKDALVTQTALASEAKGRDEERVRGETKAEALLNK